jgi:TldD protein
LSDLIGQVENGIYLDKFSSGMEDPKGWGIQVTCHYGHEIKNGKLTERMFAPIGVTGYVPEMLESVVGLSDELSMSGGFCGKGHKETVMVSSGGPHMLMKARLS